MLSYSPWARPLMRSRSIGRTTGEIVLSHQGRGRRRCAHRPPRREPVDSPTSPKPARSGSKQQVDRLAHKTMTAIEKRDSNRLAFARRVSCRTFSWRWPHVRVAQTSRYSSALNWSPTGEDKRALASSPAQYAVITPSHLRYGSALFSLAASPQTSAPLTERRRTSIQRNGPNSYSA
jgi:hypothetical protein